MASQLEQFSTSSVALMLHLGSAPVTGPIGVLLAGHQKINEKLTRGAAPLYSLRSGGMRWA